MKKLIFILLASISIGVNAQNRFFFASCSVSNYITAIEGQSNALGASSTEPSGSVANIKIWTGNIYENLSSTNKSGSSPTAGNYGIEYKLGQLMQAYKGTTQYLSKYAVGGTSLSGNWLATSGNLYAPSAIEHNEAAAAINGNVKFLIWIQGEADAIQSAGTGAGAAYKASLKNYIVQRRITLNNPNIVFVVVSLSTGQSISSYPSRNEIIQAQIDAVNESANAIFISQNNSASDGSHYDLAGYDDIATKIFNAIKDR